MLDNFSCFVVLKINLLKTFFQEHYQGVKHSVCQGLEVIKLEFILRLKIKRNDWLLADVRKHQSLCFILSLRLYSSLITSRPDMGPNCLQRLSSDDSSCH